eukprot:gnl/Spiro4/28719_TR14205_c0_g1_i1.p1 gnl/Spiro4/28719_TR14205_c0_g1~~gnl/Spiro4/28719_TR14205_c0_g1_i1.p1  ORF type:complete len:244 (+),score=48.82 gnl/Spiro4/28719_TR14205_c0_g1_i1:52-783(+)
MTKFCLFIIVALFCSLSHVTLATSPSSSSLTCKSLVPTIDSHECIACVRMLNSRLKGLSDWQNCDDYPDFPSDLQRAVIAGNVTPLQKRLDLEKQTNDSELDDRDFLTFQDRRGRTLLHYAALANKLDIVKFLVAAGAPVNVVDQDGRSPYNMAKNSEVLKFLVEKGAETGNEDICTYMPAIVENVWSRSTFINFGMADSVLLAIRGCATRLCCSDAQSVLLFTAKRVKKIVKRTPHVESIFE